MKWDQSSSLLLVFTIFRVLLLFLLNHATVALISIYACEYHQEKEKRKNFKFLLHVCRCKSILNG